MPAKSRSLPDRPGLVTTTIKKAGGSLIVTVPAKARDALKLSEGQEMTVAVEDGRLVYEAKAPTRRRSKYTLEELLAQCDPSIPLSEEEENWLNRKPVGREIW
ncbi:MAG: antitoxin [Devosia sp.]|nr:antitoxin [Devosia sp.]